MKLMESEIETLKNKSDPSRKDNFEQLKQQFTNLNRRSDDFLEQMEKMKKEFSSFSEDFEDLQKKKEIATNNKEQVFTNSTKNSQIQDINSKIQFFIDNILFFQREMGDNNRILTEYVLYFDGVERKLEEYEKSQEKTQSLPEKVLIKIKIIFKNHSD